MIVSARGQIVRALPGDPDDLPLLTRLAARMEPAMRRAFLAAVRGAVGIVDLGGLTDAVRSGQVSQIEAAAELDKLGADLKREIMPVLGRTFAIGAQVGEEALGELAFRPSFDLRNPEAIAWVQAHGAELVTGVTDSTRAAIRALVEVAFREGRSPDLLAREVREIVGLTERQGRAVERFRARLIEEGIATDAIERRAEKYAEAQVRYRSQMISRTETLEASNAGQQALWDDARAQGLLDPQQTRRVWIATMDDRLEPNCEALDGVEVGLSDPWRSEGRDVMRPPLHVACRCATGLIFT